MSSFSLKVVFTLVQKIIFSFFGFALTHCAIGLIPRSTLQASYDSNQVWLARTRDWLDCVTMNTATSGLLGEVDLPTRLFLVRRFFFQPSWSLARESALCLYAFFSGTGCMLNLKNWQLVRKPIFLWQRQYCCKVISSVTRIETNRQTQYLK